MPPRPGGDDTRAAGGRRQGTPDDDRGRRPRPADVDGFRAAWAQAQGRWSETVEKARMLDEELLHVRVDGEWSFVQTLRHLVFVTDSWIRRGVLGERAPWHPLGLPPTGMTAVSGLDDVEARPGLEEVLALRGLRTAVVDDVLARLTEAELDDVRRCRGPGHPKAGEWRVRRCVAAVVDEEWRHRDYAERDLARLLRRG